MLFLMKARFDIKGRTQQSFTQTYLITHTLPIHANASFVLLIKNIGHKYIDKHNSTSACNNLLLEQWIPLIIN